MKKTYITPALRERNLEVEQMIAASIAVGDEIGAGDTVIADVRESNPFDFSWE